MISYELAKQLKDAGFPFKLLPYELFHSKDHAVSTLNGIVFNNELYQDPLLSELIEACGEGFCFLLNAGDEGWLASRHYPKGDFAMIASNSCLGKTPEEAVANLWLALNPPTKD